MNKLGLKAIWHVIQRNYMSFTHMLKISIFPNLFDPLLYLVAMGVGLGHFVGTVNGMPYLTFVTLGLVAATAMNAANAESTVNAYIMMRMDKTYYEMSTGPISLPDIIVGQALWSGIRACFFGTLFLVIAVILGTVHSWLAILIPFVLLLLGILFGFLGLTFALLAPTRDYLNYYGMLLIQPMYMFSNTFFPTNSLAPWLQKITWFSPLTHAVALIRSLATNGIFLTGDFAWLIVVMGIFAVPPILIVEKKLNY